MEEPRAQHINHCQNTKLTTPTQHTTPHSTSPHPTVSWHLRGELQTLSWVECAKSRVAMQKRERKRDKERGIDLLVESRQSMTCGQPEGVFMWKKEREGSAASFGGTIKCLVNKLRLPFDNMHAASWAQQQKRQGAETEGEKKEQGKERGGKVISALHRKIDWRTPEWRPMTQRERGRKTERECALKRTLIVCGRRAARSEGVGADVTQNQRETINLN